MKAVVVDSKIIDLFTGFDIEREIFAREGIEFAVENATGVDEYIRLCADADALLLIGLKTPKEVIERLPRCKAIVRYGVGYDAVDVESCSASGIAVCNVPDAGTREVAGHALALMLDCLRKTTYYDRQIRRGLWHGGSGYRLHRFSCLTVGLCGFGNIARAFASYASSLGCRIVAYDPFAPDDAFHNAGVEKVGFDELLAECDVISIHIPLSAKTRHMFSKEQFAKMKPGMILVNTSRGGVVNQEHLMDALDDGTIAAAGLDVNEHEPLTDMDDRLLRYDTVVITPHCGAESAEYFAALQERAACTAVAVLRGELPSNTVNRDAILDYRSRNGYMEGDGK